EYAPMGVSGISDNPNSRANLTIDYLRPERAVAAKDEDVRRKLLADLVGDFERRHGGAAAAAHAASYRKAQRMINTQARGAFRLAWSTVLAGAGVKGGRAIGSTGKDGTAVAERPVGVTDFLATVFTAVGVDPAKENFTDGRPIRLVKGGTAIKELVG